MTIDVAEVERTLEELAAAVSQPVDCKKVNPRILSPRLGTEFPVRTLAVVCKVQSNKKGKYTVTLIAPNAFTILPGTLEITDVTIVHKVWVFTYLVPANLPGETYDIEFRKVGCTGDDGVRFMPISFHN